MHRRDAPAPPPADPADWLPQQPRATRRAPAIRDPLVEPYWSGTRVLVHFEAGPDGGASELRVVADGEPTDVDEELRDAIGRSLLCLDAVLDGVLTDQATRGGEGASIVHRPEVSRGSVFLPRDAGIEVVRPPAPSPGTVAFVAFDLLRLDGQSLLDVPLLERKRLLDSTLDPGPRVRVSPYTRPPVDPWVASWKGAGLRGAMLKAANSRYEPGGYTEEWTAVTRLQQRR
jgi:hypothetical protein